ncbi:MAG TPA: hypothetical protein VGG21_08180 [Acidimicrobiales bacterium]|jgi:hypothetical protein
MRRNHQQQLLRWYPHSWRERYGDEFLALVHDELGEKTPTFRYQIACARAGLHQRLRAGELFARGTDPAVQLRSATLLVLSMWTLFVLGGLSLQKTSEHFARALPRGARPSGQDAFNAVEIFAIASLAAVVVGVVATLPAIFRFLRSGGWLDVRSRARWSFFASGVTAGVVALVSLWAHHLSEFQRNGGDGLYSAAFAALALLVALTLVLWTSTAVAIAKRLGLSRSIVKLESALSVAVVVCMAAVTICTGWWWTELATHASWFLTGAPSGSTSSAISATMVVTVSVMSMAVLCASLGAARIVGSWRRGAGDATPSNSSAL